MMYSSTKEQSETNEVFDKHATLDSSALRQVWYSTESHAIVVQTHSGDCYQYLGVDPHWWYLLTDPNRSAGKVWADIRSIFGSRPHDVPEPEGVQPEQTNLHPITTSHYVTFEVSGTFDVGVNAESVQQALEEAKADVAERFMSTGLTVTAVGVRRAE